MSLASSECKRGGTAGAVHSVSSQGRTAWNSELANTAYGAASIWKSVGVATVGQQDEQLFKALARMAERRLDNFSARDRANTGWAFATMGQADEQLFKAMARMAEQRRQHRRIARTPGEPLPACDASAHKLAEEEC